MLIMTAPPVSQEMSNVGKHWVETAPSHLLLLQLYPLRQQQKVEMTKVCHLCQSLVTESCSKCLILSEYLFVVNGYGSAGYQKATEIVSLIEGTTIPDCLSALSDYPYDAIEGAGGALPDVGKL